MAATLEQVLRAGQARRSVATGTPAEDDQIAFMAALRETNALLRSENTALKEENEELRRQNDAMRRDAREARLEECREEFRRLWGHQQWAQRDYNENYETWTEAERERAMDRVIDIQRRTRIQKHLCDQIKDAPRDENIDMWLIRHLRDEINQQMMSDRAYAAQRRAAGGS